MRKKGQISQVIIFMVVILVISLTIVLGKYILNEFYSAIDDAGISTAAMNDTRDTMKANYATFDYAMVVLSITMIIGLLITSFMIPTHPIFLVINIFGIFFLIFIGMIMTNVYGEIVSGEGAQYIGDTANEFSLINWLMSYLPYIGAIAVFLTSLVMFARGTSA